MRRRAPLIAVALFVIAQIAASRFVSLESVQAGLMQAFSAFGIPYNTGIVLMGTGLLGLASGVIGSFAVLRRRSLVGDAVAHCALPGLCIAFLLVGHRNFQALLFGALVSGVIGAAVISWLRVNTRIKTDTAIALVLSVFFGLGIALSGIIQNDPSGQQAGLDSFLLGKTAGLVSLDLILILLVCLNTLVFVGLFYKEFLVLSFDPGFSQVQGWPVTLLDILMMSLLVVVTVIGLPAVGVVLMAAMLITPGVAARFWTEDLGKMLWLAAIFGTVTGVAGAVFSSMMAGAPTGPVIVLTGAAICMASMMIAPKRGVLAKAYRTIKLQKKIATQNLLRTMFELTEDTLPVVSAITVEDLTTRRAWSPGEAKKLLTQADRQGLASRAGDEGWKLTSKGLTEAASVVRTHRLWEIFLVEQASIAASHVDRDADMVEHILPPEMVTELENRLKDEGRLPALALASVHPLGQDTEAAV